jgi:MFS family permease
MLAPRRSGRERTATRSLTGWVVGFGCSVLADQVFFLSLAWAAVQLGVPGLVGVVLAAGCAPRLLVLLVGGVMADARSPKRIILGTDSARALVMAAAGLVLLSGAMKPWALVAVAIVVGTLDGFFLPAVAALPVRVAPPHLIGRVAALRTLTQRLGMLGGGPLAGWLIYLFGPSAAFLGSAILFALSVGSLALVTLAPSWSPAPTAAPGSDGPAAATRPDATPPTTVLARAWAETTTGFQIVRASPVLAGLLLLIGGMNVGFSGPFTAGIPLLAAAHGWGARGAGLLIGAFGTGAAVSGLSLCLLKQVPRAGLAQLAAVLSMGLAVGAVGVAPTLPVTLTAAAVLGLSSGVFGTIAYALLLSSTPTAEVGRMMALLSLTLEGSAALSFLATGTLTTTLGAAAPFLLGGLLIVATALTGSTRPHLRALQMDQAETAPHAKRVVQDEPSVRTEPATQLALTAPTR